MYILYMVECEDGSLITGVTTDLEKRFQDHVHGIGGHFVSSKKAKRILYTEQYTQRSKARKREVQIRKWSVDRKLTLATLSKIQHDLDEFDAVHSAMRGTHVGVKGRPVVK
jgi:putative endonuclease